MQSFAFQIQCALLEDIAILTGGTMASADLGIQA
jgi:hypothetical protein